VQAAEKPQNEKKRVRIDANLYEPSEGPDQDVHEFPQVAGLVFGGLIIRRSEVRVLTSPLGNVLVSSTGGHFSSPSSTVASRLGAITVEPGLRYTGRHSVKCL